MNRAGLLCICVTTAAAAHEGLHAQSAGPAADAIDASVQMKTAHVTLPGARPSDVLTLMPGVRAASRYGVWVEAALPVHHLQVDGVSEAGPGDLMTGVGYGLLRGGRWSADVALWSMWPTGNPYVGLGGAHVMVAPQVSGQVAVGRFALSAGAALRGAVPWGEHAQHQHQPIPAPHDLLDVQLTQRGAVRLFERLELCAHLEEVAVLTPHPRQPVGSRAALGVGAALTVGDFLANLAFTMPITRHRAWDWQVALALTWRFSAPSTDPQTAHPSAATHPSGH